MDFLNINLDLNAYNIHSVKTKSVAQLNCSIRITTICPIAKEPFKLMGTSQVKEHIEVTSHNTWEQNTVLSVHLTVGGEIGVFWDNGLGMT